MFGDGWLYLVALKKDLENKTCKCYWKPSDKNLLIINILFFCNNHNNYNFDLFSLSKNATISNILVFVFGNKVLRLHQSSSQHYDSLWLTFVQQHCPLREKEEKMLISSCHNCMCMCALHFLTKLEKCKDYNNNNKSLLWCATQTSNTQNLCEWHSCNLQWTHCNHNIMQKFTKPYIETMIFLQQNL
jgi:hypothetical protein